MFTLIYRNIPIFTKSNCIGDFEHDEEVGYIKEMNLTDEYKRVDHIIRRDSGKRDNNNNRSSDNDDT